MSELQAGMLALVIGAANPDNIGAMVDVVRKVAKGDPLPEISENSKASLDGWLVEGNIKNQGGHVGQGVSKTEHLLPIPPLADPLDVTHKEELHD